VRIIARKTLIKAWTTYRDAEQPLRAWYKEADAAEWTTPEDVRARYHTASIVGDDGVVFNIRGNRYRLVIAINYAAKIVYVKFFGTHAEYDKIDVTKVQP
jgi:mRNA interferase HigB